MTAPLAGPPKPVVIDSRAGQIFGWYHAAYGAVEGGEGVVLCNPFGYEAVCSHRSYRELASRLAAAGFPALRFDYHGTGDSSGDDRDPGRVAAMLESVKAASAALQSLSGAKEISLFGVRMGATLAMQAASEMGGVKNLVAWAPCVKGKTYLREMKAFRRMTEKEEARAPERPARPDGDEEAGGFLMTKETVSELAKLNLLELTNAPARSVLVIPREGSADDPAFTAALRGAGCEVDEVEAGGYSAMMIHPHASVVPHAAFDAVLRWLSRRPAGGKSGDFRGAGVSPESRLLIRTRDAEVEESPVFFGEERNLFGIVSEGGRKDRRSNAAVIFLNAGHVHRIGPSRFYARFARQWAALGVTCFRIDLSGLGDSRGEGSPDELMFSEAILKDVEAAMDHLRSTRSIDRFVLVGLCSGAYTAFHAGLRFESVVAEILVNPPTFYLRAGAYSVNNYNEALHYGRAFFRGSSWGRALRGQVDFARIFAVIAERALNAAKEAVSAASDLARGRRESHGLPEAFRELTRRGVDVLLVFSPGEEGLRYVEEQLGPRAGKAGGSALKLEIVDGADHTFSALWSQDRLCELLTNHVAPLLGG